MIKGEIKGNDTEGVIKARASVHISGAKTLYSINYTPVSFGHVMVQHVHGTDYKHLTGT